MQYSPASYAIKSCAVCGQTFTPRAKNHQYCSKSCYRVFRARFGSATTARQYKTISGNWYRYFSRLVHAKRRPQLTPEILIKIYQKQKGRCALTGVQMTCTLERGKRSLTNASIDRKVAGGAYTEGNIQLVCSVVNRFRSNLPIPEFLEWCKKVVTNAVQEQGQPELPARVRHVPRDSGAEEEPCDAQRGTGEADEEGAG